MADHLTRALIVDGASVVVTVDDEREQLLYVLRNELDKSGPKFGCGVSQCGACTVLVDGEITRSCVRPLSTVPDGASITTLEGIGTPDEPHQLQQAFIDHQAAQCAYCVNGMIMGSLGWIQRRVAAGNTAVPSRPEIRRFLSGEGEGGTLNYICRCGAHNRIVAAIHAAAKEMLR